MNLQTDEPYATKSKPKPVFCNYIVLVFILFSWLFRYFTNLIRRTLINYNLKRKVHKIQNTTPSEQLYNQPTWDNLDTPYTHVHVTSLLYFGKSTAEKSLFILAMHGPKLSFLVTWHCHASVFHISTRCHISLLLISQKH